MYSVIQICMYICILSYFTCFCQLCLCVCVCVSVKHRAFVMACVCIYVVFVCLCVVLVCMWMRLLDCLWVDSLAFVLTLCACALTCLYAYVLVCVA